MDARRVVGERRDARRRYDCHCGAPRDLVRVRFRVRVRVGVRVRVRVRPWGVGK